MKSLDINKDNRFLGYYYGIGALLGEYPVGFKGWYFLNGETNSVWMWDTISGCWINTNRVDGAVAGTVIDPSTFIPQNGPGIKVTYLYLAQSAGTITFLHFKNGIYPVSVTVDGISLILLFWNGDYWEVQKTSLNLNLDQITTSVKEKLHIDANVVDDTLIIVSANVVDDTLIII